MIEYRLYKIDLNKLQKYKSSSNYTDKIKTYIVIDYYYKNNFRLRYIENILKNNKKTYEYYLINGSGGHKTKKSLDKNEFEKLKKQNQFEMIIEKHFLFKIIFQNNEGFVEKVKCSNASKEIISVEFELDKSNEKFLNQLRSKFKNVTKLNIYQICKIINKL